MPAKICTPLFAAFALLAPALGAAQPSPLRVHGNRVVNARGETIRLRGVNVASLEWSSDGEGHVIESVGKAIDEWHATIIRVPLSQDRWFGLGTEQHDGGTAYRALVERVVGEISKRGAYAILDLHWSNAGHWGGPIGQHVMPDRNSITFWRAVGRTYRNHPAVIFDLYNEPHDVTWEVWRNGGSVTERARRPNPAQTYEAVGMQTLLQAVRRTGADNVVIVGGLDWSYDLSGVEKGRGLNDHGGNGIIYANHAYPFKGDTVEKWAAKMDVAIREFPVIVSEFGSDPNGGAGLNGEAWVARVLQNLDRTGMHYTAWDFHPAASPCLIKDWTYAPTVHFGVAVKAALARKK